MEGDPVYEWFQRGLDLHGGFGRKVHPSDGGPGFAETSSPSVLIESADAA
jgi:hypothetical protein